MYLFNTFPNKLLGIEQDAKTKKGKYFGVTTGILYFTPSKGSGVNLCPMAKIAKCEGPCLNTAGRGAMSSVQVSRLRKTLFYLQYRNEFKALLRKELDRLLRKASKAGMLPACRLNGTSDIRWEQVIPDIMVEYQKKGIIFYDYTKIPNRDVSKVEGYDLTYSYSGVPEFQPYVQKAVANNSRMAVVFRTENIIPKEFMGMKVVNGDQHDIRFQEPQGVISALKAKGKAKQDMSGFVVD
jgi:hypothetical protein